MVCYQSVPTQVVCGKWDSAASREVPPEKQVDMKCMQVNILKHEKDDKETVSSYHTTCMF